VHHLIGAWAFAVWNPEERRLFLARDHFGKTALYYVATPHYIAFASGRKAILALDPALHTPDDYHLAQQLLTWPNFHGASTSHLHIRRLPPAHHLTASAQGIQTEHYWEMHAIPQQPVRTLDEAVEGFLPLFDAAIQSQARHQGTMASALSAGLDSSTVTAGIAPLLAAQGNSLISYTAVPLTTSNVDATRFIGNEWDLAATTARYIGINQHRPVHNEKLTPLAGLQAMVRIHDEPPQLVRFPYWQLAILQAAQADGVKILMTGQEGNSTISWIGEEEALARRKFRPARTSPAKDLFFKLLPKVWANQLHAWLYLQQKGPTAKSSAHPDLLRRTQAVQRSRQDSQRTLSTGSRQDLHSRLRTLDEGRSIDGGWWQENGAAFGMEIRDPTVDLRVLTYCLSLPDALFYDAKTGMGRMLIRQAMQGRLPDAVRLNQKRGFHSADLHARLCADAHNLNATLARFEHNAAASYVSLDTLRYAWGYLQQEPNPNKHHQAINRLLSGLAIGLFVEQSSPP
jgi:asparagine synthase (glutamine-hydrolysing)